MKIKKPNNINLNQVIFLLTLAVLVSTINIFRVIIGAAYTPSNYVYLAVGHYFQDYFEYLQQIAQGGFGHWLVENQFTIGDPTKTLIGWGQYLFYGKIGSLFNFSAVTIYWLTIFILGFFLFILIFKLIEAIFVQESFVFRMLVLVIVLTAVPFIYINSNGQITPYDFWYAPMSFFHRFGGVPHHLLTSIISISLLLLLARLLQFNISNYSRRNILELVLTLALFVIMITFAPFQIINILSSLVLTTMIIFIRNINNFSSFGKIFKLFYVPLVIIIILVPIGLIINMVHKNTMVFAGTSAWEITQIYHPSLKLIILTTGPILLLVPFGIRAYLKQASYVRLLFLFFIMFSYLYFFTNISLIFRTFNMRFLTPLAYLLFGSLSLLAVKSIIHRFKQKGNSLVYGVFIVFIMYFIPVNIMIYNSISKLDQLSYIPQNIIDGMKFLNTQKGNGVLTSPGKALGLIVPVYADKNMYLGRMMFTPDFETKISISDRFYKADMDQKEARQFLIDNQINFVLLTSIESTYNYQILENYSFLKNIYKNNDMRIYKFMF